MLTTATGRPQAAGSGRLALHPENPHYFRFRGRPTVLVTSGEHYGAVLNPDFDFFPYLDELRAHRFNLTRTFSGSYCEPPGAFNIAGNTLAPAPGRFLSPWARSAVPGYGGGGNRFDLSRWDEAYFQRLREFVRAADERGIVVELVLFCPLYDDQIWSMSPFKASNNVNGVGDLPRERVLTLQNGPLLAIQDALVRKLASELREADNLYFEICNEPYFGGVTREWQDHVAAVLTEAEARFGERHLIAQNIANGAQKIQSPNPAVGLFNFHYANPPDAVPQNYGLNKAIGFDETGFKKTADAPYRMDAWEFLLAGGAVYDNLDYSFTAEHPDGTAPVKDPTPGGGGPALRRQLAVLKEFMESLPFLRMKPADSVLRGSLPEKVRARALAEEGRAYGIYVRGAGVSELRLALPEGRYRVEWVNTLTGAVDRSEDRRHPGGDCVLVAPPYAEDVALRVRRR